MLHELYKTVINCVYFFISFGVNYFDHVQLLIGFVSS